ncbi:MAG: class I SAM-dependent methyltransferase [Roseiflexaceae bacterium]
MFGKHLQTKLENSIKVRLLRLTSSPLLGYIVPFLPYQPRSNAYMHPKRPSPDTEEIPIDLPVPPEYLWLGYGKTTEVYLGSGKRHVDQMLYALATTGWSLPSGDRVLDFGCGAGRMTRWFADLATTCEIWGTDISAEHIVWCQQHLTPPLQFVTTTTMPHLPFEDHTFGLIYANSVFSHLDDLADAWFLELRRIARPGGRLYITVMDQTSIEILAREEWKTFWLAWYLLGQREYRTFIRANFGMFTIGRALRAQVFYDRDYLCRKLARWFKIHAVIPEAYGFQTGLILEKVATG